MEETTPEWLNEEFLSKCLQGEDQSETQIKVTNFQAGLVVPAGNNYGSNLLRVKLEFKEGNKHATKSLSLVIKYPLANNARAEAFGEFKDVEFKFYYQFMPQASKLSTYAFAPKSYFSPMADVTILEDLKVQGYAMADRIAQLDFDHCQLYAVAAAAFHAVSVAVHKVDPELVETLGKEKLFSHDDEKMYKFTNLLIQEGCECVSNYMEKTVEFKKYAPFLRKASNVLLDKVIEAHQPSKVLNCLNQGDPWTTNMMFKYDEFGKVSEIKLLDFQVLRYGSPVNDLIFFLWTSANNNVRENKLVDYFNSYHRALNNKLKELNCTERLSYDDLLENIEALKPLMLMIVLAYLPHMIDTEPLDVDELITRSQDEGGSQENKANKYFNEDYCKNHLSRHLKQLESMGVLKYLQHLFVSD